MRVLLDECLPRRLRSVLVSHEVQTVPEVGWAGIANGDLLHRAATRFDVFVTIDQNLPYQQNLQSSELAIIVLESRSSRYDDLLPLVPRLLSVLSGELPAGETVRIGT